MLHPFNRSRKLNMSRQMLSPFATSLPIFWGIGTADELVSHSYSAACVQYLTSELGLSSTAEDDPWGTVGVHFESYQDMPHTIGPQELQDVYDWLKEVIPATMAKTAMD